MTPSIRDRIVRRLGEAEGYLVLGLPDRTLEILRGRPDWATMQFEASLLTGEALRRLGRVREALKPLETAAALRPGDLVAAMALGWCYKRTHRLAQAIDVLERARRDHPEASRVHYNLACYWSLAGDPARSFAALEAALKLEPALRAELDAEPDFDPVRHHPGFHRLVGGCTPHA